jgi:hypothetical protein
MPLTMKNSIKIGLALVVLPTLLFGLYTWASLNWVYSSGERAGYVQKFRLKATYVKPGKARLYWSPCQAPKQKSFYSRFKMRLWPKN